MNLKNILPVWGVLLLFFVVSSGNVFAFSFQAPPAEKTGAPNESTCMDCHVGNELNASDGSLMLAIPETYIPNEVYTIVVNLSREGQSRWGFEMTALDADGGSAGSFIVDDAGNTGIFEANSKQYIHHTTAGTAADTNDANSWEFQWTAPDADMGPVTFYAAGNAANGDSNTTGDYIYTKQSESASVVGGVSLEIVGEASLSTVDAVEGVSYTLKVTNTGNAMDAVTLEASAEVGIEGSVIGTLSESSIELEADGSAEVILMVTGDLFPVPGDYTISVTATSGTDSTMTAEATTTTTIEMPPPPPTPWDVNDDGTVNIQDLVLVANELGESGEGLKGDLNGDGTVNIQDLVIVASHFGEDTSN